jgi:ribonuclease HI
MQLRIYTDGGCSGNPGPGGWAYVIIGPVKAGGGKKPVKPIPPGELFPREGRPLGVIIREQWGAEKKTTNNRMELYAAVAALEALAELNLKLKLRKVTLFTDSQYVQKGMSEWIHTWKLNGWRTSDRKPVKNQELWLRLDELAPLFPLKWEWVRGHAGNEFNELCDQMTQEAIASL